MRKKRGKAPSLITGSSGTPKKVTAKKKRECGRRECTIKSGEICFEVPQVSDVYPNKKTFCRPCFKEMLEKTRKDLDHLDSMLED